jgi:hypothetical protein
MMNEALIGVGDLLLQVRAQTEPVEETNDVWSGWGSVILVVGFVALVALILALVIWQLFKSSQTWMLTQARVAEANAYRTIAEEATAAQARSAEELEALRSGVDDLRGRVATIERLLAEVG